MGKFFWFRVITTLLLIFIFFGYSSKQTYAQALKIGLNEVNRNLLSSAGAVYGVLSVGGFSAVMCEEYVVDSGGEVVKIALKKLLKDNKRQQDILKIFDFLAQGNDKRFVRKHLSETVELSKKAVKNAIARQGKKVYCRNFFFNKALGATDILIMEDLKEHVGIIRKYGRHIGINEMLWE